MRAGDDEGMINYEWPNITKYISHIVIQSILTSKFKGSLKYL